MKKENPLLFPLSFFILVLLFNCVSAGTQHGINGMVNNASDGTNANGADVFFYLINNSNQNYCNLSDKVGVDGNSKKPNWYAVDVGNCPIQWKENDTVYIFIFKDENHTANTSVKLSMAGNDQAPTVNLSSPFNCGDNICSDNETCLNCPQDCAPVCNNNSICEPCPGFCQPVANNSVGACENLMNCADCFCNPLNGICEPENGENCSNCPFDCHCPDGKCQPEYGETISNCPQDCICGNGVCDAVSGLCFNFIETSANCLIDCPGCVCGDSICQAECNENVLTCCQDCCICNFNGICELGESYANCPDCPVYCGNLICEPDKNETPESCPTDCANCGNGICEPEKGENWQNCPNDCYAAKCGDKKCELAENKENCCKDCLCDRKGIALGPLFLGKVELCIKNKCTPSCCLFGFCWGIYINNNKTISICWYYVAAFIIIVIAIIAIILTKAKKKKKDKIKEKNESIGKKR